MEILSSQFKHSPRAFDVRESILKSRSENTDEYSICMTDKTSPVGVVHFSFTLD